MDSEMITVRITCGRRVIPELANIHGKSGQVRLNQSWETEFASVFGVNLQSGRYIVQRVKRDKDTVLIQHDLSEKVQLLRSEFVYKQTMYVIHLCEKVQRSEGATTSAVVNNSKVNTSTSFVGSTPSPRRTDRVTGNWKQATKLKENRVGKLYPDVKLLKDHIRNEAVGSTSAPQQQPARLFVRKVGPDVAVATATASERGSSSSPPPAVAKIYNMDNRHRPRYRSTSKGSGFFRNFRLAPNEQLSLVAAKGKGRGRGRPRKVRDPSAMNRIPMVTPSKKKKSILERIFKTGGHPQERVGNSGTNRMEVDVHVGNVGEDLEVTTSTSKKTSVPIPVTPRGTGNVTNIQAQGDEAQNQSRVLAVNLGTPLNISGERVHVNHASGGGRGDDVLALGDFMSGFKMRANSNFTIMQLLQAREELMNLKAKSFQGSRVFNAWSLVAPTASGIIRDLLGV